MATRPYSTQAVEDLQRRAAAIFGDTRFIELLKEHRDGSPLVRHRLIDQLIAIDDLRHGRLSAIREDAALAALPETDSVITLTEAARDHSSAEAWNEVRRGFTSAAEYLHSVGVVQVASLLRIHHPRTEFIATPANGKREPDLMLLINDALPLAVEVKAPAVLWQPTAKLGLAEGRHLIRNTLASAGTVQGQLRADRPGVLALTGLLISDETYDTLVMCFEHHLASDGPKTPHLLGLAISNLRQRVESSPGKVSPLLEQKSVIRRNPAYSGSLHIDNDWAKPWRLLAR